MIVAYLRYGLVEPCPDRPDTRGTVVRLIPAARHVIDRAVEICVANEDRFLAWLDDELRALDDHGRKSRATLEGAEPVG
jgi:hypothetical protein